jgi:hypothetical protein
MLEEMHAQAADTAEQFGPRALELGERRAGVERLEAKARRGDEPAKIIGKSAGQRLGNDEQTLVDGADELLRGKDPSIAPLLPEDDAERLTELRHRLRTKQMERGRLQVLLSYERDGAMAEARSRRVREVGDDIAQLTELILKLGPSVDGRARPGRSRVQGQP